MTPHASAGPARMFVLLLALMAWAAPAQAQQPSSGAIAIAKEIITVKGSASGFDAVVPGVVEQAKAVLLQTNPTLAKDLNDVALRLRTEYTARANEPLNEAAKAYASRFTEPELKDILTFYKSPVGQKLITEEPAIFEKSMGDLDAWAANLSEEVLSRFRIEMKKKGHEL